MSFLTRAALRGFMRPIPTIITKPRAPISHSSISCRPARSLLAQVGYRGFASENTASPSAATATGTAANESSTTDQAQETNSAPQEQGANSLDTKGFDSPDSSQKPREVWQNIAPNNVLYIGNIFFEVREDQLKKEFERIGEVKSTRIIYDRRGLSKGYGYVEFEDQASATKAVEVLNQQVFEGRRLVVQYHVPRPKATQLSREPQTPSKTLFIGNLSFEMSDRDLNDIFREIKNVIDVRVAIDRRSGQPRGFAHADFVDIKSAEQARDILQNKEVYGRKLRVDFSSNSNDRSRGRG